MYWWVLKLSILPGLINMTLLQMHVVCPHIFAGRSSTSWFSCCNINSNIGRGCGCIINSRSSRYNHRPSCVSACVRSCVLFSASSAIKPQIHNAYPQLVTLPVLSGTAAGMPEGQPAPAVGFATRHLCGAGFGGHEVCCLLWGRNNPSSRG